MVLAQLAELFPTPVRAIGTGFNGAMNQICKYTNLNENYLLCFMYFIVVLCNILVSLAIFCALMTTNAGEVDYELALLAVLGFGAILAAVLLWLLPETSGHPTLQTIHEAKIFYKKHFLKFKRICPQTSSNI